MQQTGIFAGRTEVRCPYARWGWTRGGGKVWHGGLDLAGEYLNFKLFQMDNYTDTIMLTEAASADEAPPLTAMMTNTAYNVDNFETLADDLQWYIERDWAAGAQRTDAPALVPFSYARYWHGYLIWLRPLLLVTDITGVRVVQYLVLAVLFAAVAVLLRRRCGLRAAVWFAVSQLVVTAFSDDVCLALLVLGVVTSFCDLLVTPVLTLGLPLVCWLLEPQQRLRAGTRQCGIVVGGSLTWGVGYLQLLGIGNDGHIGFNEPNEAFELGTHCVDLKEETIEANKRFFDGNADLVPKQAYTMGIKTIMQARKVLMVANGKGKADIVKKAFFGPVTPESSTINMAIIIITQNITICKKSINNSFKSKCKNL